MQFVQIKGIALKTQLITFSSTKWQMMHLMIIRIQISVSFNSLGYLIKVVVYNAISGTRYKMFNEAGRWSVIVLISNVVPIPIRFTA